MTLDGKVAIVAGASRGIGADIAKYLARAGAKVAVGARTEVVQDPRLPGTIYSVAAEIAAEGGSALPVVMNVRDPDSIELAVQRTVEEWGGVDILVHNAAIFVSGGGGAMPGPGPYPETVEQTSADGFFGPAEAFVWHFTQTQARQLQATGVSVNLLLLTRRVRTPGNIFAENDPQHPTLDFETADSMGKAAVWISEQPVEELTGSILVDTDICDANGL